jgi:diacylglycerol kinase family enzyme
MKRLLAIANPISGRGRAAKLGPRLAKLARLSGVEIHLRLTTHAGHSQELARDAKREGYDGIVSCGGDGTLNDVINGMKDAPLPVMIVAMGTGNVLAKEIGASHNPMRYLGALREWKLLTRDLARMQDGRLFACFIGAGFDGECTRQIKEVRRTGSMKMMQYVPAIWRAIKSANFKSIAVKADDASLQTANFALASITPSYGGPLALTPHAIADDGKIDVLTIHEPIGFFSVLRMLLYAFFRRMPSHPHAKITRATRVEITAQEADGRQVPIQVDGDFAGYLPVSCEMLPKALTMFNPR